MQVPILTGEIERRILVNYRVEPEILQRVLPGPFRPQLVGGFALAGVCLIRLGQIRPRGWPGWIGIGSENAAHRIAVEWDTMGRTQRGVYIPRRDTSSRLNAWAGGRLFPGEHHRSRFQVREAHGRYRVCLKCFDNEYDLLVEGQRAAEPPPESVFNSLAEASDFFEQGSIGYSATTQAGHYDGLELRTLNWSLEPLAIERLASSFFDDQLIFPARSINFDSAFLMRNIQHQWHSRPPLTDSCAAGCLA